VATSAPTRPLWPASAAEAVPFVAYALGAIALAGEAAVHVQQYFELFHEVPWIGSLFLANAVACIVAMAGLAYVPTRQAAAWAGIVISVLALGALVISYENGLFGWQEAGFRTPILLVLIAEVGAVTFLATALVARSMLMTAAGRRAAASDRKSGRIPGG
jgi:hypothetical protein